MSETALIIEPITDPPRRADNLCALDTCRKPIKSPGHYQRGVDRRQYDLDPFCSSPCAKAFYGVDISVGRFKANP